MNSKRRIGIYVDHENIHRGRFNLKFPDTKFDPTIPQVRLVSHSLLWNYAESFGRVFTARTYSNWTSHPGLGREMSMLNFSMHHFPWGRGKNGADIQLVLDAIDDVRRHNLDTVVIASGDSDISPLISRLRGEGVECAVVGVNGQTSRQLPHLADHFVYYQDLFDEHQSPRQKLKFPGTQSPRSLDKKGI